MSTTPTTNRGPDWLINGITAFVLMGYRPPGNQEESRISETARQRIHESQTSAENRTLRPGNLDDIIAAAREGANTFFGTVVPFALRNSPYILIPGILTYFFPRVMLTAFAIAATTTCIALIALGVLAYRAIDEGHQVRILEAEARRSQSSGVKI
jgi:hypothetical protein